MLSGNCQRGLPWFALALLCLWHSAALAAPAAEQLLQQMAQAERSVSYSATATTAGQGEARATMRVWRSGAKRRLEYTAPPVRRGDVVVDDGTSVWTYHRAENSAVQTHSRPDRSGDWARLGQTYTAKLVGQERQAGRPAWMVAVYAKNDGHLARKYWIDQATKARLRAEWYSSSGQLGRVALDSVQFGAVDPSRFVWRAPAGASVQASSGVIYSSLNQARRAAAWLQYPHYLPSGYGFESAVVESNNIWLRYTNGLNRFSIFQQRAPGEPDAGLRQVRGGAWYWRRAGSRFLLVGLSDGEASKIAQGVS